MSVGIANQEEGAEDVVADIIPLFVTRQYRKQRTDQPKVKDPQTRLVPAERLTR